LRTRSRRFRLPLAVAWTATVGAIAAAVGPNLGGQYSPSIAVLTLTLISVIWYTYFTYREVHREEPGRIEVTMELSEYKAYALLITIGNPTPRVLSARLFMDLWVDDEPVGTGATWQGSRDHAVRLDPGETLPARIDLSNSVKIERDEFGGTSPTRGFSVKVRFKAEWTDEFGDEGSTGIKYWKGKILERTIRRIFTTAEIDMIFGPLSQNLAVVPQADATLTSNIG
jgi:hypothetical protein